MSSGCAVGADRNLVLGLPLAVFGRVVAQDLLADDAPGRDAVDGDAVLADLAREALGPGVHRRLGAERAVDALGLRFAGEVDDPAPAPLHHLGQQPVGELALAREVEGHRLFPLLLAGVEAERTAAAGAVDQDLDRAEPLERPPGDLVRRVGAHQVAIDDHRRDIALAHDLLGHLLEQLPAAGDQSETQPLFAQRQCGTAPDAAARPGHEAGLAADLKVHRSLPLPLMPPMPR